MKHNHLIEYGNMVFKITLLVLNFSTAFYKDRYFSYQNEENPAFEALSELRMCARNLGLNIVKFRLGMKEKFVPGKSCFEQA